MAHLAEHQDVSQEDLTQKVESLLDLEGYKNRHEFLTDNNEEPPRRWPYRGVRTRKNRVFERWRTILQVGKHAKTEMAPIGQFIRSPSEHICPPCRIGIWWNRPNRHRQYRFRPIFEYISESTWTITAEHRSVCKSKPWRTSYALGIEISTTGVIDETITVVSCLLKEAETVSNQGPNAASLKKVSANGANK